MVINPSRPSRQPPEHILIEHRIAKRACLLSIREAAKLRVKARSGDVGAVRAAGFERMADEAEADAKMYSYQAAKMLEQYRARA